MSEGPRPTVTLKIATSLDGRIATASGESKWITGEPAREEVHRLRAAHDAVLVGSQTVIDDDPELTVRLPGYKGPQPLRVVADARGRVAHGTKLFNPSVGTSLLIVGPTHAALHRMEPPTPSGPDEVVIKRRGHTNVLFKEPGPTSAEGVAPSRILQSITLALGSGGAHEPTRVLLEGGGKLAASFMRAGLIDRIEWFRAPIVLGGDGRPALAALELARLADAPRFKRLDVRAVGDDLWERYERQ